MTAARAGELMGLRISDVIEDGTVLVLASTGGKTESASRIMPLHELRVEIGAAQIRRFAVAVSHPDIPLCHAKQPPRQREEAMHKEGRVSLGGRFPPRGSNPVAVLTALPFIATRTHT